MMKMLTKLKYAIKQHKILFKILKPIYRLGVNIKNFPRNYKASKQLHSRLKNFKRDNKHIIWYFGVTDLQNLGDQAIRCCTDFWLKEYYSESVIFHIYSSQFNFNPTKAIKNIKKHLKETDLIVIQGGFTFMDSHPDEKCHYWVPKAFPKNKIVIFPNTILYKKEQPKRWNVIDSHEHLLFLVRDKVSYQTAKQIYPNTECLLFPDIVTSYIGKLHLDTERKGILICTRDDSEKGLSFEEIDSLVERLSHSYSVDLTDTVDKNFVLQETTEANWEYIREKIASYAKYKLVITDRYHGMIFSLIAGTPVIAITNNNHKIFTGASWFKEIYEDYVYYTDDLIHMDDLVAEILGKKLTHNLKSYFNETYYSQLKNLL